MNRRTVEIRAPSPRQSLRRVKSVTEPGRVWRRDPGRTLDGLIEALTTLSGRFLALEARTRELAGEFKQLREGRRHRRSRVAAVSDLQAVQASLPARAGNFIDGEERRRLERDLHDGLQNELVALIVKLTLAEQDRGTSPCLAGRLSALGARAQAVLDSVRQIACGSYSPVPADFGVAEALRAQARRASNVSLAGTAPRSTEEAEAAVSSLAWRRSRTSQNTPAAPHTQRSACTTTTRRSPCASKTTATGLTPRTPPWCGPQKYPRSHPDARRHRQAHFQPRPRHHPDDFAAMATADNRRPLRQFGEFGSRGDFDDPQRNGAAILVFMDAVFGSAETDTGRPC
jgi:Histidine kinase